MKPKQNRFALAFQASIHNSKYTREQVFTRRSKMREGRKYVLFAHEELEMKKDH